MMFVLNETTAMFPTGHSMLQEIIFSVLLQISGIIAAIGNLFVMSVIICNKSLHTPSNILLLHLALIDHLTGICLIIASAFYIEGNFDSFHEIENGVSMCVILSIFNLLFIGIDRLLSLSYPFQYMNINDRVKSWVTVAAIWFLATIVYVFSFYGQNFVVIDCGEFLSNVDMGTVIREFTLGGIVLISIMIHIRVYCIAANQARRIAQSQTESQGQSPINLKAIKTTLIVLGAFCVCYFPVLFFQMSTFNCSPLGGKNANNVLAIATFFLYSGCTVNPVIYTLRREEFKNQIKRFLNKCCFSRCKLMVENSIEMSISTTRREQAY
ncbi:trace amine-associated receptor 5-like [Anneissia japonica]|uniref:trace amine-associated receptor 5-like n=1 Tax=Anneissia japonica TaxID=1529436 RepID=UPI001425A949|nr:trace amine-associated receptor 5-like [Anneissia japonica]